MTGLERESERVEEVIEYALNLLEHAMAHGLRKCSEDCGHHCALEKCVSELRRTLILLDVLDQPDYDDEHARAAGSAQSVRGGPP